MAPGIQILRRAGVLEDVRKAGFSPKNLTWRKIDGTPVATVEDVSHVESPDAMIVLPLGQLNSIMLAHAEKNPLIEVKWNCQVIDVEQDQDTAWAIVQDDDEGTEVEIIGDFLVGCDGGSSQVRKSLFGTKAFPGKTWDVQFVATNVYYPFDKFNYDDMNMIIDQEHCHVVAKIQKDGLWRVSYQEAANLTFKEVIANQPAMFEKILPGHPKPEDYKLMNINPYKMHQRCAERFRVGRICLAADAAHLCNPWGGLGLTGGFADALGLADCLIGIANGRANHRILNKYDEIRRSLFNNITDPVSTTNYFRVSRTDPDTALENDPVLAKIVASKHDPKLKEEIQKSNYALCHDFTQYYNDVSEDTNGVEKNGHI
ncbi:hypothetical protein F5884DRAFT_901690 [Xylogone sp. PMI_703]|nr:hypothetical protein F5884DRAFT_901690 [Xylogone sp. PMI_703]